jgi:hypothetical protein
MGNGNFDQTDAPDAGKRRPGFLVIRVSVQGLPEGVL